MDNVHINRDRISKGGGSVRVEAMLWGEMSEIPAAVMDCSIIVGSGYLQACSQLNGATDDYVSDLVHWIAFTLFDEDTRSLLCQTMSRLLKTGSNKSVYLCHEIRTQQREAQFVHMIHEAGLRVQQEIVATYSPCLDARVGNFHAGFALNSAATCVVDCSRLNDDGLCLTTQSSTDLDCENRDVVILKVYS
jgi:hypothetical protein